MIDGILKRVIDYVSWIPWIFLFLQRHKTIRNVILIITLISLSIAFLFGLAVLVTGGMLVARLAFAAVFMISQFAFLFMFLSQTKTIEIAPGDKSSVSFEEDYYGNEIIVELVTDWTSLLTADRKKLDDMGAKGISGILLEGPPGTGKTLLTKCLASYSNSWFYGIAGTDFQAMFFGVGPLRVMRMYSKARKAAKEYGAAIIFIDEIDAIGGSRGGVTGDPRRGPTQGGMAGGLFGGGGLGVLSRLLIEMDGTSKGELGLRDQIQNRMRTWFGIERLQAGIVLTMGATNRFDALDQALLRPGRFDKHIRIDLPDEHDRRLLFEGYLKKVRNDGNVDIEVLVSDTGGVSQAAIALAVESDAPRYAIKDNRDYIIQRDIENGLQEQRVGLANPVRNMNPEQKRSIAIHEAGHALVVHKLRPEKRITRLSIIRRSRGILGYMWSQEREETYARPLKQIAADIQVSLAGGLAVEVKQGEPWTGIAGDVSNVQQRMYYLAVQGYFGQLPFKSEDPFSSKEIKEAADKFLSKCQSQTLIILRQNENILDALTEVLLEKEDLTSEEIYGILERFENGQKHESE